MKTDTGNEKVTNTELEILAQRTSETFALLRSDVSKRAG